MEENAPFGLERSIDLLLGACCSVAGEPAVVELVAFFDRLAVSAMAFASEEARREFERDVQAKQLWLWRRVEARLPRGAAETLRRHDLASQHVAAVVRRARRPCGAPGFGAVFRLVVAGCALEGSPDVEALEPYVERMRGAE